MPSNHITEPACVSRGYELTAVFNIENASPPTLRNLFLTPTTEMLSFFQDLQAAF